VDKKYLVALYSFNAFGPARTKLLVEYFGTSKDAWNATSKQLLEIGLRESTVENFINYRDKFNFEKYFSDLEKLKVNYVTVNDKDYPQNLKDLDDAPIVIYYKGENLKNISNAVSIVGSRKMTSYGKEVAYRFSYELASFGLTIVSGLALGVDSVVHRACVDAGGKSIAVVASGLDYITPVSNYQIAKDVIKHNGLIFSEYPVGYRPTKIDFPNRNRIISGLSKAVIVIEGERKSGTLLTASHAANQGRTVFAVPGQITSPMSGAPHFLIQNGAKIAFSTRDILDELDIDFKVDKTAMENIMPSDNDERKILEILDKEPLHLDEVARISMLKVGVVSAKLTVMELKRMVKNIGEGVYKKIIN